MTEARVLLTGAQYQALSSLLATVKKDSSVDVALRHSDESQNVDVTVYFSFGREANIWRIAADGHTRDMGTLAFRRDTAATQAMVADLERDGLL